MIIWENLPPIWVVAWEKDVLNGKSTTSVVSMIPAPSYEQNAAAYACWWCIPAIFVVEFEGKKGARGRETQECSIETRVIV